MSIPIFIVCHISIASSSDITKIPSCKLKTDRFKNIGFLVPFAFSPKLRDLQLIINFKLHTELPCIYQCNMICLLVWMGNNSIVIMK